MNIPFKRNIRLDLEYDGRNYCGWQWQPNLPTIEGAVKQAVEKLVDHEITLYSCGRTDAGVHAEQHVVHFFTDRQIPYYNMIRALNTLLPDDISVYHVQEMPLEWSARHDPVEREYRYTIYNNLASPALFRHRAMWVRDPLDIAAMRETANLFVGEHDFSSFRSTHCDATNPVRKIYEFSVHASLPLIWFSVRGSAFLRHQVRTMSSAVVQVGRGRLTTDEIVSILQAKDRTIAPFTLPAHGLTLVAVRYSEDLPQRKVAPLIVIPE